MTASTEAPSRHVVLVTGASGFLGSHVIEHLLKSCPEVSEIRAFDLRPSQYTDPRVVALCGDVTKEADVERATRGVDSVVHTAGLISFGTKPDIDGMMRVNVHGTAQLLAACEHNGVQNFVYTSTIDVAVGHEDIIDGDESLHCPPPSRFLFPGYPESKWRGETLVKAANGPRLKTISLRPNVMYGERDPFFITTVLRKPVCGYILRFGDGLFQQAYAGNVAWAHICALRTLWTKPTTAAGKSYFITDDTPVTNVFDFVKVFANARGLKVATWSLPLGMVYWPVWLVEKLGVSSSTGTASIANVSMRIYFNRSAAEKDLGYKPLYSYKESIERSLEYYINV